MKILLVPSTMPDVVEAAQLLRARCICAGIDTEVQLPEDGPECKVDPADLALVVSMGGDGTFLRAARLTGWDAAPLMGLNYGSLGFLTGNPEADELQLVADALAGDLQVEHRSTLDATITTESGKVVEVTAFNEIAYSRGAGGHVVQYSYSVNGTPVASLSADGLIISTATGSTAYALSAGGPLISPGYKGLLAVPLAPHSLNSRAMVLAPSDVIEVEMFGRSTHDASLFIDGNPLNIDTPVSIVARRGEHEVDVVNAGSDFFKSVSHIFFGGLDAR